MICFLCINFVSFVILLFPLCQHKFLNKDNKRLNRVYLKKKHLTFVERCIVLKHKAFSSGFDVVFILSILRE